MNLQKMLEEARKEVEVGAIYAHYKHPETSRYRVVDLAFIEADLAVSVIYQSMQDGILWVRPVKDFVSTVYVDEQPMKRFEKVSGK
ncbi:MAG: DUF1653 domain-containing protein [Patescibacteria group bacterium]|jgi:hypothetical protein